MTFKWKDEHTEAMDQLTYVVATNPVLQCPNYDKPFFLEVDASQYITGAILSQKDEWGKMRVVGSISQSFTPAEQNYDIHNRELLTIIHGLRAWWHLLLSSPHVVTIFTDHKNLTYYRHTQRIARHVAWYLGELADYNFVLIHKPGIQNKVDSLSWQPDYDSGIGDNNNITVLPEWLFLNAVDILNVEQKVYETQEQQEEQIKKLGEEYPLDQLEGQWFYHRWPMVPDDQELQQQVIFQFHDHLLAGHPGITNTTISTTREFWWPTMRKFIINYIRGCAVCQSMKPGTVRPKVPSFPITQDEPQKPFQTISLDLITDLLISQGYNCILTIVDHRCSKAAIFLPCHKNIDAIGVASLYTEWVFPFYGVPQRIISDRDPRFTAQFAKELCLTLGINQNLSTAYHPQMDGQSKRANQRVEQYLWIHGNEEKDDWVKLLPLAQYTHNTWINESTRTTLFELLISHTPMMEVQERGISVPEVEKRKAWLEWGRLQAHAALQNAQKLLTKWMERRKGERHYLGFKEGDHVWLEGTHLRLSHPSTKLASRRYRPFVITKAISPIVFKLELPQTWKIHDVFHASLLTPYHETVTHGANYPEPPLELIEGEEEYIIDWILNSWQYGRGKQLQFLIHWEGYSAAHDSWELASEVHAPVKVEEYYQQKKGAVRMISIKEGERMDEPYPTTPLILSLLACSQIRLMDNGTTQQPQQPTTSIPEWGNQDRSHNQHSGVTGWYHNNTWYYTQSAPSTTAPHTLADDNWQKLYRALLHLDSPMSNTLSFNNTLRLVEDTGVQPNVLTPPLTEDLHFTTNFQNSIANLSNNAWDYSDPALSIVPINSTVASPQDEDQLVSTTTFKSIQLCRDVYNSATTPGSDTDRQQWLHAELCDSLCAHPIDPQDGEWYHSGSPGFSTGVKQLSLNEVAMRTTPRKKARTWPPMKLTRFYCSKCRVDDAEHSYENCPTWKVCGFCDQIGHWGYHCLVPHCKCTRLRCGVHVGHRNIGSICPWSRETKLYVKALAALSAWWGLSWDQEGLGTKCRS